jgi:hypothetical protein
MSQAARTPEELEALLEDAFVTRDEQAVARLFEDTGDGEAAARLAHAMWDRDQTYFAGPRRVVQARDTALVLTAQGINVAHRSRSGAWRYAIALIDPEEEDRWTRLP